MHPLLTLCTVVLGLLAFNTRGVNTANSTTWTFNGLAHITFKPDYQDDQSIHLKLRFRTRQPNGLLFYHYLKSYDAKKFPLLKSYELFAEIRQGYVRVGSNFNQYSDVVPIGSALNNDKWHQLEIYLDTRTGEITVTLDDKKQAKILEAFQRGGAKDLLKWSELHSEITYGGTEEQSDSEFFYFVGCLSEIQYTREDGILMAIPVDESNGATEGCSDLCKGDNQCLNGGTCVNLYTSTRCDCFGTEYEGEHCDKKGPTVMTFRGYEWVTYQLYEKKEDRLVADKIRISFEFKTERGSGVLLYAVGGTPFHSHLTAAINVGVLQVSIAIADTDIEFAMGLGLDNGRWHNVTISHSKRDVDVFLDGERHHKLINGSQYFMTLDPKVYFGGGHNFVETRGLQVTQTFVGCLRNVYFNDFSVLHGLRTNNSQCAYHGGLTPEFKCDPTQEIPFTFPRSSSMLRHNTPMLQNLTVSLQFKTVRKNALLFYVELISKRDGGAYDFGFIEVWVKNGLPLLYFSPSKDPTLTQNLTLPAQVNNKQWHSLKLTLKNNKAKINVDETTRTTSHFTQTLRQRGKIVLGYGLRRYKNSEGFVGCMKAIKIQDKKIDPINTIDTSAAVGIKLDGCHLVNYCAADNICEHNSECLSDWDGVQCDCPQHYEGKACHFSKYPRTCDAYFQSGRNTSGVYLIDLDGSGNLDPVYVQCHMNKMHNDHMYGETVIDHNFRLNTTVRGSMMNDVRYHLDYRGMSREQLRTLTLFSYECRQHVAYRCRQAPLQLGMKTWFKAANGEIVDYLSNHKSGYCDCDGRDSCDGQKCFCDHASDTWREDVGFNGVKSQLPLVDITILQSEMEHIQGEATLSLGPLRCWGNVNQPLDQAITITQENSYIRQRPWVRGDLYLSFKTHQTTALLIYQNKTDTNANSFLIKIVDTHQVAFNFYINGQHISHTLYTASALDGDDWHTVGIERDPYNMRLTLDGKRQLVELPDALQQQETLFNGMLMVGGIPERLAEKTGERTPGFTGCIRGFLYNGKFQNLEKAIDASMGGVYKGCVSSCWPNPCDNGGTCVEAWDSYQCKCKEKWSHHGLKCEVDINRDSVTFSGHAADDSFLFYNMTSHPEILMDTIILSFRTFQTDALLLYAHDHLNNFVQLKLTDGNTITITFNSYKNIISDSITLKNEMLNDGQWQQVIAEHFYNFTRLHVHSETKVIRVERYRLDKYARLPFDRTEKEDVLMSRPMVEPAPFVNLYVGGVMDGVTFIPSIEGCIRGLKIADTIINLGAKARERGNSSALYPECEAGCYEKTCFEGYCDEHWKDAEFNCDCSETQYTGTHCELEPCAGVAGNTVVQYGFTLEEANQHTRQEQVSLTFKTMARRNSDAHQQALGMIFVQSSETKDYVLVWYEPGSSQRGSIVIETNQAVGVYRMKVSGNFANGEPHRMTYKRSGPETVLTVTPLDKYGIEIIDGERNAKFDFPDFNLDKIDTIYIGGVVDAGDLSPVSNRLVNFTGTISNVVFKPRFDGAEKVVPLKAMLNPQDGGVTVLGDPVQQCSMSRLSQVYVTPTPAITQATVEPYETLTMPPWDVGRASMDIIGRRPGVTTKPVTTTTTSPPLTNLTAPVIQGGMADDLTVAVAVSIIAALLIVAVIIAFLLCRQRKRQEYDIKKEHDFEMKQPLNHNHFTQSPVPADHLAKLDEFSMVSATLGPRPAKRVPPPEVPNRFSQGSFPLMDEEFPNVIYNRKKKRPASSISEVLEEMERRQKAKDQGLDPDAESPVKLENRNHGEGELDWDPTADTTPLTCGDITFFNSPLLLSIPDENEELQESSTSPSSCAEKHDEDDEDDEKSPDDSTHQNSTEYNGDSGYEAESRPENTEEDATPDSTVDIHTPPKMYMYDLTNLDLQDSPSLNDPSRRLLTAEIET
ncbi:contactin-associated protein-like 2 isoform X3 [Haliotis rufescens]|uniref:contactin-associated protein-like 2 isoform X3 n=1 Tax=Haliotis rufescens TaxID=6454 RepID=UPI00201F38A8|nr:contactin-associated protein-like 2 isoform X3 [Haliotis rufescens]